MPNATITFTSNLTHNDGAGSTVSAATTSDVVTGTGGTAAHVSSLQQVTVSTAAAAATVALGSVDVTKEYAVRFRNGGWATASSSTNIVSGVTQAPCIEIVLQTAVSTYVSLGRMYLTEMLGPIRMVPQVSGYPKLLARVTDQSGASTGVSPMNLEVIAGDMGAPTYST